MAYTILYIATSQDGFIADKNGSVDWLPQQPSQEDMRSFEQFVSSIDVIAQGSRTFLQTLSFIESGMVSDLPYGGKHMYVFTHEPLKTNRTDVTFVYSIDEYLRIIDNNQWIKRVWLLGGANLIESFKNHDLIDECIITIIPKILYEGLALPSKLIEGMKERPSRQLSEGIIEKTYVRE